MNYNSEILPEEVLPFVLKDSKTPVVFVSKNHSLLEEIHHNLLFLDAKSTILCPRFSFYINHEGLNHEGFLKNYIKAFEVQPQITLLHASLLSIPMPEPDLYSYKTFKKSDTISITEVTHLFTDFGYTRTETVHNNAEFAVRGYIIDFTSFGQFYRLELYGNKIEEIKTFDPSTQKSIEVVPFVEIYPNKFLLSSFCNIQAFKLRYQIAMQKTDDDLFFALQHHPESCDVNKYTKLLVGKTINILDILPENILLHNATSQNIHFSKEINFFEETHQIPNGILYYTEKEVEGNFSRKSVQTISTL